MRARRNLWRADPVAGGRGRRSRSRHTAPSRRPAEVADRFLDDFRCLRQSAHIVGRGVEADHHGLVLLRPDDALDELAGGLLLEPEAVADAVAGVDQHADAQRHVGFLAELGDFLPALVLDDLEVFFVQIHDESALLVGDREEHRTRVTST